MLAVTNATDSGGIALMDGSSGDGGRVALQQP